MTARIVPPEGGWPPFEDAYQAQFLSDAIAHAQTGAEGLEGAELAVILARLDELEAVVRRAKFVRDSPAPYSVSRAAEQAAAAESARKILGPLAGEQ